jgi:O-antigen ligase
VNDATYHAAADYSVFAQKRDSSRILDWTLVGCLCLLLAFGPLAFGAVQEWAICTLEVAAAVCMIIWAAGKLVSGRLDLRRSALFLPIVLFAALVGLQLVSGRTAYWFITWRTALMWSAYGMIFFVTTQALYRTAQIRIFAFFFVAFGFLVALFSIVQQFTWNGNLYWVVPNRQAGWVYGPYVDHAHYAGLMEMLVAIPLVFAMMSCWQKPLRVLFGFAAVLMASTIFLSGSRGGMVAFGLQMILLAVILGVQARSRSHVLLLLLMAVLLALWLVVVSPGGVSERIGQLSGTQGRQAAVDRLRIAKDILKMIAARPVLGWGLGTFPIVYPSFRTFPTNFFVNAAHNDYAQMTVETGLMGLAIICAFIVFLYRAGLSRIESWRTDVRSATSLAGMIGVTGILMHSFWDFNLQIPANAALFFALAALTAAAPMNKERNKR